MIGSLTLKAEGKGVGTFCMNCRDKFYDHFAPQLQIRETLLL